MTTSTRLELAMDLKIRNFIQEFLWNFDSYFKSVVSKIPNSPFSYYTKVKREQKIFLIDKVKNCMLHKVALGFSLLTSHVIEIFSLF